MNLFEKRVRQFKEYLKLKNKESRNLDSLKYRYKEKSKEDEEYDKFKRVMIKTIDDMFYKGKTKIVIRPKASKVHLFDRLVGDKEFTMYYKSRVVSGSELEIELVEV